MQSEIFPSINSFVQAALRMLTCRYILGNKIVYASISSCPGAISIVTGSVKKYHINLKKYNRTLSEISFLSSNVLYFGKVKLAMVAEVPDFEILIGPIQF
jgi:hypothetical protein